MIGSARGRGPPRTDDRRWSPFPPHPDRRERRSGGWIDQGRHAEVFGSASGLAEGIRVRLLPSPCNRRLSLIPTESINRRALTFPNPGSDSRTESTFIFPTVSLESAVLRSSERVIEPSLSFSFTSARSRRTLAALARAAWRCSGVRAGGCGMVETIAPPQVLVILTPGGTGRRTAGLGWTMVRSSGLGTPTECRVFNTGSVVSVDLNADLAEGDELSAADLAVLVSVTSVSLACGSTPAVDPSCGAPRRPTWPAVWWSVPMSTRC